MRKYIFYILLFFPALLVGQTILRTNSSYVPRPTGTMTGAESRWSFENNTTDEEGNHTLSVGGSATYNSVNSPPWGSYCADCNGGNEYFGVPSFDYSNTFTILLRFRIGSAAGTRTLYGALTGNNGFEIQFDFASDRLEVLTGNGTSVTEAYSNSSLGYSNNTWYSVAVTFDRTNGTCKIYFEGSDVTSSGTTRTDYNTSVVARIGLSTDNSGDSWGYFDDVQVYLGILSPSSISTWHSTPGTEGQYSE